MLPILRYTEWAFTLSFCSICIDFKQCLKFALSPAIALLWRKLKHQLENIRYMYLTAALVTTVKIWKQPNYPSIDKWVKKMWHTHTQTHTQWNICCYCLVAKLCLTLCDTMNCSLPGSSVHGISQARILLLSYKKEGDLAVCYNMVGPRR